MHLAVAHKTLSSIIKQKESQSAKRTAIFSEIHDCPCSRSKHSQQEPHCPCCFTRVITMLRDLPLHFIGETYAAKRALCGLVKGSFTTSHCVHVTLAFQTSVSRSQVTDSLTLVVRLLALLAQMISPLHLRFPEAHGFFNHVDSLVACRSLLMPTSHLIRLWTVVILGGCVMVLRHRVWAMFAPLCH